MIVGVRRFLCLYVSLVFLAAACSETETSSLRVERSGTSHLHHVHEGFPHYLGHFEATTLSTVEREPAIVEGFEWFGDGFYEARSTDNGSTISFRNAETGNVEDELALGADYSGTGLTIFDDQLFQLTSGNGEVVVYDLNPLTEVARFEYEGEGWGVCNAENNFFVMSNGSSQLTTRSLETFELESTINVTLAEEPIEGLDELECVGDQIWATLNNPDDPTLTNTIVGINADTGEVEASIDTSTITQESLGGQEGLALSALALDRSDASLWFAGNQWRAVQEAWLAPAEIGVE